MNANSMQVTLSRFLLLITLFSILLAGCGGETFSAHTFVGKWKSSKLDTPIHLYDNGEWEIKDDAGAVLQYGVWRYKGDKIIWSIKIGSNVTNDVNPVLSATATEFQVMENSGVTTTFSRLD